METLIHECPICLEEYGKIKISHCGHYYCRSCLNRLPNTFPCTICRANIEKKLLTLVDNEDNISDILLNSEDPNILGEISSDFITSFINFYQDDLMKIFSNWNTLTPERKVYLTHIISKASQETADKLNICANLSDSNVKCVFSKGHSVFYSHIEDTIKSLGVDSCLENNIKDDKIKLENLDCIQTLISVKDERFDYEIVMNIIQYHLYLNNNFELKSILTQEQLDIICKCWISMIAGIDKGDREIYKCINDNVDEKYLEQYNGIKIHLEEENKRLIDKDASNRIYSYIVEIIKRYKWLSVNDCHNKIYSSELFTEHDIRRCYHKMMKNPSGFNLVIERRFLICKDYYSEWKSQL